MELDRKNDSWGDFFIDYVIWPEALLTQELFRIVTVAHALDVENFADGTARLLEYKVKETSPIVGKMVKDCGFTKDTIIVGVKRGDLLFIPNGNFIDLKLPDKSTFLFCCCCLCLN